MLLSTAGVFGKVQLMNVTNGILRLHGVKPDIYNEGTHLVVSTCLLSGKIKQIRLQIPWFESPIIFDIRAKPRNIASLTGTKGTVLFLHKNNSHLFLRFANGQHNLSCPFETKPNSTANDFSRAGQGL